MAKPKTEKVLILIRHAHRDKLDGGSADNGLSSKGHKQAEGIRDWFKAHYKKTKAVVISSPKVRCVETVEGVADLLDTKIETVSFLDEGGSAEGKSMRLEEFWLQCEAPLLVACSHGDILPVALHHFVGARADISKGALAEIEGSPYGVVLRSLIQSPE
jgi:8-oxo-dGTP diphosphatase